MQISLMDWGIIAVMISILCGLSLYAKRFMRSSADFLAANRVAGRYLLAISSGFLGAITMVAAWEMNYSTGLPPQWWGKMSAPLGLFMLLTGFVTYRFRQTRALTLAQFFEMRYSRNFRFFAGMLCWLSGLLNYGIFPAVTSRILIHFLGLPESFDFLGITVSTFPSIMIAYLSLAVYIACTGGMISIMITGFFQSAFVMAVLVSILLFLATKFSWSDIMAGLNTYPNPEQSLVDPFKGSTTSEFNILYFLTGLFMCIYGTMSWQGGSGYAAAAKTPHESILAGVINSWRYVATAMWLLLVPLLAYSVLHLAKFSELAAPIHNALNQISDSDLRLQMTVPITLAHLLPAGLAGLFVTCVLFGAISCDDVYTHSWGTILIQDVITPLRGKPFTPKTHMLVMRLAIIGVAIFGFTFSMIFPLKGFILMFFSLTAAIYVGGVGAVIIGGLYWKRGTTAGAWCAMTVGTICGLSGMALEQTWKFLVQSVFIPNYDTPFYWLVGISGILAMIFFIMALLVKKHERFSGGVRPLVAAGCSAIATGAVAVFTIILLRQELSSSVTALEWFNCNLYAKKFPISGQLIMFGAAVLSVIVYVGVSLLGKRSVHNMDMLLHRGEYAINTDGKVEVAVKEKITLSRLIGIGKNFTRAEKLLFICSFIWNIGWWLIFLLGCAISLYWDVEIPDHVWSTYWYIQIASSVVIGVGCTVWILIGGIKNCREMFRDLRKIRVDDSDDGFIR